MSIKAMKSKKIGFIGAGNMAFACIKGFVSSSPIPPSNFYIYDLDNSKYQNYIMLNINFADNMSDLVKACDYIVLAVKPQHIATALDELSICSELDKKVFISFAAGISTDYICSKLKMDAAVVRTMPNTPFLVGKGTMAASKNCHTSKTDFELICSVFSMIASVTVLEEDKMNSVISLNGSSPAYIFRFYKAMVDSACEMGFSEKEARQLILTTFDGAVTMLKEFSDTKQLIKNVTSPNGTTQAALESLDRDKFDETIRNCMNCCTSRAIEIATEN